MKIRKIEHLRETLNSNHLPIAFVGSGLSANHPDWFDFLIKLAEYSEHDDAISELRSLENNSLPDLESILLIIDECLDLKCLNENDLRAFMGTTFRINNNHDIPPVFSSLVRAPFAAFITTNYDTNIEDAFKRYRGKDLPIVLPSRIDDALRYIRDSTQFILKIHGCANLCRELVIGHEDYQKIILGNKQLRYVLAALQATHPVVFMGYGHRDPHISLYLEYEHYVLPKGGLQRFTFLKKSKKSSSVVRRLNRLKISNLSLNNWDEIGSILDQSSFLRIRDNYRRGQREHGSDFRLFIQQARPESVWGAIMYAFASSDLGHSDDIQSLLDVVENNIIAKKVIKADQAIELAFCLVIGQMLKRKKDVSNAHEYFLRGVDLAKNNDTILAPLRSQALRYAAIFFLWPGDFSFQDLDRSKSLLNDAMDVLGDDFKSEQLDVEKWQAVFHGETSSREESITMLIDIASKAERLNYLKNSSWCRLSAVDQWIRDGFKNTNLDPMKQLKLALEGFNDLEHVRGLGEVYLTIARVLSIDSFKGTFEEIMSNINRARALGSVAGDNRIVHRCDELEHVLNSN